ncbi:MAG: hypothetical protein H6722_35070, partial [Sandaracinus sp.]|nr:hypothetical protein [Sandaracinus sp.]
RGIVYAPDYAINAGGLINVAAELEGYDAAKVRTRVEALGDLVGEIVDRASKSFTPTHRIADTIAQERLAKVGRP